MIVTIFILFIVNLSCVCLSLSPSYVFFSERDEVLPAGDGDVGPGGRDHLQGEAGGGAGPQEQAQHV